MLFVTPEQIGAVLALSPLPHSMADLELAVLSGLPVQALSACVEQICLSETEQRSLRQRIAPVGSRKHHAVRLAFGESERLARVARVYASALHVWGGEAEATRTFLRMPHALLEGRAPLEAALAELGARRVEDLLGQLYWGLAV